jgi:hypothetical protein
MTEDRDGLSRRIQRGGAATKDLKISRKADFAPSPPLATSARDAKAQRKERDKILANLIDLSG